MGMLSDLRVLYHMALKPVRGKSHAERLESFYSGQAGDYDEFRKRLLHGREAMYQACDHPENGIWVDMGGGTGSNLEYVADRIGRLKTVYVVDLASSLLKMADQRVKERNWTNVRTCEQDATTFTPDEGYADLVTFSYSLTMIPDWFAAIENARRILRPGGQIGVVDFYVSRKWPADACVRHRWFTRSFWPIWFSSDNVFPSADHLPYLERYFQCRHRHESHAKVPYVPVIRMPYYSFVGVQSSDNEPQEVPSNQTVEVA